MLFVWYLCMNILLRLFLITIICVLTHTTSRAHAQGLSNVGYAPFNLTSPRFNCNGFFEASKDIETLHIAFLYNTFGNDFSCLERLMNDPRLATLEIHLINEPGHRNNRLGSYEFLATVGTVRQYDAKVRARDAKLKRKLFDYVQPLKAFLDANLKSHTELLINPGLESNLSDTSARILISWTRQLFPDTRVVWNPLKPNPKRLSSVRGDIIEGHNLSPNIAPPCIYNLDGTDVSYPNRPAIGERAYKEGEIKNWVQSGAPLFQLYEAFANECEVAYVWTAESNGINEKQNKFVDPRRRNHNISTAMYKTIFADIKKLQEFGKVYPKGLEYSEEDNSIVSSCDRVLTNFEDGSKTGRLLKQSEFRDRGGVLILNRKFSSVNGATLIKGRRVVDIYSRNGFYKDGRVLFRSRVSPINYPFNTYLVFEHNNQKICYKLPNPRVRLD